jgi:hypothetical protein
MTSPLDHQPLRLAGHDERTPTVDPQDLTNIILAIIALLLLIGILLGRRL